MKARKSGRSLSVPGGLTASLTTNLIITLTLSVIIAAMLHRSRISWESAGYWIMAMLLFSSFIGAKTAMLTIKTQPLLIALMSGIVYWTFLVCFTALFGGGNYSSVLETGGLIAAGSTTAALIRIPKKQTMSRKKRNINR